MKRNATTTAWAFALVAVSLLMVSSVGVVADLVSIQDELDLPVILEHDYKPLFATDVGPSDITTQEGYMRYNTSITEITFQTTVINYGTSDVTSSFWANVSVKEKGGVTVLFTDDYEITSLTASTSTVVTFAKWTYAFSSHKNYTVTVTTNLTGDQATGNDSVNANFEIIDIMDVGLGDAIIPSAGELLHTSSPFDVSIQVVNYGTYKSTAELLVRCRIFEHWSGKKIYDENATADELDAQMEGEAVFAPAWTTPTTEGYYVVNFTLSYQPDRKIGNNATQITVWVNDLLDVKPTIIELTPDQASYAQGENISTNVTVEVTGNVIPLTDTEVNLRIFDGTMSLLYDENVTLSGFSQAERTLYALFPNWTTPTLGTYTFNVTVDLANDEILWNDFMDLDVEVTGINHNVGPSTITASPTSPVAYGQEVEFTVPVVNYGDVTEGSVNVTVDVRNSTGVEIYNETVEITEGIGIAQIGNAIFNGTKAWMPPMENGAYKVTARTKLHFDSNPNNDVTTITMSVINKLDATVDSIDLNTSTTYRIGSLDFNATVLNSGDIPISTDVEGMIKAPSGTETVLTTKSVTDVGPGLTQDVTFTGELTEEGDHTISVWINSTEDEDNTNDVATLVITVSSGQPPVVMIASPLNNSQHAMGDPISFSSEGTYDPEGGNLTYNWVSGRDGVLSDQPNFATSSLSADIHVITLTVEDEDGFIVVEIVYITVVETQVLYYEFFALNATIYYTGLAPTVIANNKSLPPDPPVGLMSLGLYYELSVGGTFVTANVSIDYSKAPLGLYGVVDPTTVNIYRLSTSWVTITGSGRDGGKDRVYAKWSTTMGTVTLSAFGEKLTNVTGTITGHVVDSSTGDGIGGATVNLYNATNDLAPYKTMTAGSDGKFTFSVIVGDYYAMAMADGYTDSSMVALSAGTIAILQNISLSTLPSGDIQGVVKDSYTNELVEGVTVTIKTPEGVVVATTTTDETGTYLLEGIFVGAYLVNVSKTGYIDSETAYSIMTGPNTKDLVIVFVNTAPTLSSPSVSPTSGNEETEFTFTVTYTDVDGDAPLGNVVYVVVGSQRYEMTGSGDYASGVVFTSAPLTVSSEYDEVTFTATDRRGESATPETLEVSVSTASSGSEDAPIFLYIGGVVLVAVIIAAIVAVVLFFLAKKKESGDQEVEEMAAKETVSDVQETMCTGCGSILEAGVTTCPNCGRDLTQEAEKRESGFLCPSCGALNEQGATKCRGCAKDFTASYHDTTRTVTEEEKLAEQEEILHHEDWDKPTGEYVEEGAGVEDQPPPPDATPVDEDPVVDDIDFDDLSFEGLDD